jgi:GxxExxY protein
LRGHFAPAALLETSSDPVAQSLDDVTHRVIGAAIAIHRRLGPGLLEAVYRAVLARSPLRVGFQVELEKAIALEIDGMRFEHAFRADLIVARTVLVEVKACESLEPVHTRQILTYMRCTNVRVGLLMNFGSTSLKRGLRRFVDGFPVDGASVLRVNQPRKSSDLS